MFKLLFALLPLAAFAQQPLRLEPLIEEALRVSPELLAAQKAYEAARQRPSQESALPDPMFSVSYNSVGNPLPVAGIGTQPQANAGAMISQMLPFPGKRELRGGMAGREAEAARWQYESAKLSVASRVKQAYYRLAQAYAATELLESNRDLLQRFLRVSESRYSVGRAAQQDIFRTQTQLSIIETRIERLRQEIRAREGELNALLNRPASETFGRPEDVQPAPLRVGLDQLLAAARDRSPMLEREQKMIQRAELAANLARKELYPDFTLSGGAFSMGSMGQMYMARLDFTLPFWAARKQRAGIAEQVANLSQARHTYEASTQNLNWRVKEDYAMAETSFRLMDMYRTTVIPQSDLAAESSLASYQTGAVDQLTVLMNIGTQLEYEMNLLDERLNYLLAVARMEEMTGIDPTRQL